MTSLQELSNKDLQTLTLDIKKGILAVIDMGEDAFKIRDEKKGDAPQSELFGMKVAILASYEREITRRGMDPKHPAFGMDLIGEIISIQVEEMANA